MLAANFVLAFGRGERGSSKLSTAPSFLNDLGLGGVDSLNPPIEGEYMRSPHDGNSKGLGETEIGARSYEFGE